MPTEDFFKESREQSRIKARIVAKYFWAWAKVITSRMGGQDKRIAYVDLFAGPGQYGDQTTSTPVIVLKKAIKEHDLRENLVTIFNDKNAANVQSLQETIKAIPDIEKLRYEPQVRNEDVGQKIIEAFSQAKLIPTFLFVDPWGYKGLSLGLINSVLQNWGSDCVFFFNYNRINPGLSNDLVRKHMNDLFGESRAGAIREKLNGLSPEEREALIKKELSTALKELGAKFVLHFTFRNE
jgi:three-Cys-motif partner protein